MMRKYFLILVFITFFACTHVLLFQHTEFHSVSVFAKPDDDDDIQTVEAPDDEEMDEGNDESESEEKSDNSEESNEVEVVTENNEESKKETNEVGKEKGLEVSKEIKPEELIFFNEMQNGEFSLHPRYGMRFKQVSISFAENNEHRVAVFFTLSEEFVDISWEVADHDCHGNNEKKTNCISTENVCYEVDEDETTSHSDSKLPYVVIEHDDSAYDSCVKKAVNLKSAKKYFGGDRVSFVGYTVYYVDHKNKKNLIYRHVPKHPTLCRIKFPTFDARRFMKGTGSVSFDVGNVRVSLKPLDFRLEPGSSFIRMGKTKKDGNDVALDLGSCLLVDFDGLPFDNYSTMGSYISPNVRCSGDEVQLLPGDLGEGGYNFGVLLPYNADKLEETVNVPDPFQVTITELGFQTVWLKFQDCSIHFSSKGAQDNCTQQGPQTMCGRIRVVQNDHVAALMALEPKTAAPLAFCRKGTNSKYNVASGFFSFRSISTLKNSMRVVKINTIDGRFIRAGRFRMQSHNSNRFIRFYVEDAGMNAFLHLERRGQNLLVMRMEDGHTSVNCMLRPYHCAPFHARQIETEGFRVTLFGIGNYTFLEVFERDNYDTAVFFSKIEEVNFNFLKYKVYAKEYFYSESRKLDY